MLVLEECYPEVFRKQAEMAAQLGFAKVEKWHAVEDDDNAAFSYTADGEYQAVLIIRVDATTDVVRLQFLPKDGDLEINVNWRQEA
jgi:hypothetical protein